MECKPEPAGELSPAQQKRGCVFARCAKLTFQRNEAVGIGTGDAEIEREVFCPARLGNDLVKLLGAVEGEVPDAEIAIGARNCRARLYRIHKVELGAAYARQAFDFAHRSDVEAADAGFNQGL